MTARTTKKKRITTALETEEITVILAALQTSIDRIRPGVHEQTGAQVLADMYSARDKILASIGTTYEVYESSWNARTNEVAGA